jgi:cytochrome c biogenesis protein CcmG, thiol:disulfide interchange protein DsbE
VTELRAWLERWGVLGLRVAAGVGVLVLGAVLLWRVTHQPASAKRQVSDERIVKAPNFDLVRLNGTGKLSLASLRGKVVVINFWASDCVPCKKEMPRLEAASRQYAATAEFIGIDVDDAKGPAQAFLKRYGATYPAVFDPTGVTAGPYGVLATPQTFFVDRRGRLIPPHVLGPATDKSLAAGIRRALQA